jgi:hypothetical protein
MIDRYTTRLLNMKLNGILDGFDVIEPSLLARLFVKGAADYEAIECEVK